MIRNYIIYKVGSVPFCVSEQFASVFEGITSLGSGHRNHPIVDPMSHLIDRPQSNSASMSRHVNHTEDEGGRAFRLRETTVNNDA